MLKLFKSAANSGLFIARRLFAFFARSLLPAWRRADFAREACRCADFFRSSAFARRGGLSTTGGLYIIYDVWRGI